MLQLLKRFAIIITLQLMVPQGRLMALSDHWRPIFSISDTDVVKLIKKDKIDIQLI